MYLVDHKRILLYLLQVEQRLTLLLSEEIVLACLLLLLLHLIRQIFTVLLLLLPSLLLQVLLVLLILGHIFVSNCLRIVVILLVVLLGFLFLLKLLLKASSQINDSLLIAFHLLLVLPVLEHLVRLNTTFYHLVDLLFFFHLIGHVLLDCFILHFSQLLVVLSVARLFLELSL